MSELIFPGDTAGLVDPKSGEQFSPALQEAVEKQFGLLPEFRRTYDRSKLTITQYDPSKGYIRFQSVTSTEGDIVAWQSFSSGGSVTEYQLLDAITKDRVDRQAFFTRDWEGKLELVEADVQYRQNGLDTQYHIDYDDDGITARHISVKIFSNRVSSGAGFADTELVQAHRDEDKPWEIRVAHGNIEQLEEYYREQKREHDAIGYGWKDYFPGVLLELPQSGSDILAFDGLQGLALAKEKPKQIDTLQLGRPKVLTYRGAYRYLVNAGKEVFISRSGQDDQDRAHWEISLFNDDNLALDRAMKDDWVNLKEALPVKLVRQ